MASACEILCLLWRLFGQWSVSSNQRGSLEVSEVRSPTTGHTGPFVLNLNYRCFRSNNSIAAGTQVNLFCSSQKWTFYYHNDLWSLYHGVKFSCTDSLATYEMFPGHPTLQRWRQPTVVVWLIFASKVFFPEAGCARFELFSRKATSSAPETSN